MLQVPSRGMERPADLELGRLATPEEDEEFDEPEEEEEKLVDRGEEQEVVVRTEEKVVGEEKEHVEEEEEEEEDEVDVKKGEKISLLEGRESPPLSSANTSMNTSGGSLAFKSRQPSMLALVVLGL